MKCCCVLDTESECTIKYSLLWNSLLGAQRSLFKMAKLCFAHNVIFWIFVLLTNTSSCNSLNKWIAVADSDMSQKLYWCCLCSCQEPVDDEHRDTAKIQGTDLNLHFSTTCQNVKTKSFSSSSSLCHSKVCFHYCQLLFCPCLCPSGNRKTWCRMWGGVSRKPSQLICWLI